MDIHRARFVPYPPSAINALAFSHAQSVNDNKDPECLRLAIGRANGNIEIWNPANGAWLHERVFYGGKDRSVEGLVWTQEPDEKDEEGNIVPGRLRLFSIGYSNSVTEWDLSTGLPARHSDGNHSEVWCLAARPRADPSVKKIADTDTESQQLVAGCADGTLVLISTADNDVRFERFLSRSTTKKARVLSITYKDRNTILAGFADSTIRVYDTRNSTVLRSISLGSGPPGGPKDILVWKVKCLPNGDFVSGDSTGEIRIYDGKSFSQIQRISGHEADVLDLAVSRDGTRIFSGGMDRRTCFFTCNKKKGVRGEKWRKVSHSRHHEHDVKAMATYEGSMLNVIVSGGIDTQPIVIPLRQYGRELTRGLSLLPHSPPLVSAPEARLMVSWWNCEIRIWRVKSQADGAGKPKVIARLALKGDENITSVSITADGNLLAVATASGVKLFGLSAANPAAGTALRIRKLITPTTVGAKLVRFSADSKWLAIVSTENHVHLGRIKSEDESEKPYVLPHLLRLHRLSREDTPRDQLNGSENHYSRSITHVEFSPDSDFLAVADLAGYIDTWVTEGHEDITAPEVDIAESVSGSSAEDDDDSDDSDDSEGEDQITASKRRVTIFGQRWIRNPSAHLFPRLDTTPLLLSFRPNPNGSTRPEPNGNPAVHPTRHNPHPHSHDLPETDAQLLIVSAKHQLYLFDVMAGRLSDWSRKNPPSRYPSQYRLLDGPAKGCVWDMAEGNSRLWLYGEKWLFMFDTSKDFPRVTNTQAEQSVQDTDVAEKVSSKKRKRESLREALGKSNSGAGDAAPQNEVPVPKARKFDGGNADDASNSVWFDLNRDGRAAASDDDFEDDIEMSSVKPVTGDQAEDNGGKGSEEDTLPDQKSWWHTFKYRPILGIVPVGGGEDQPLEVVLVERPSWDLDLPPRFVGTHE